ncbi:MAG: type ISP restriction/modification enzyme, partial [Bryobacteraceae bacterium]
FHTTAILNTPAYRQENNDALRQDWPRIPLPTIAELLSASAELGRQVADLLDPDSPVNGVTSNAIRPELRVIGIISSTIEGGQLNPDSDLNITADWGHYGKGGAVMPAKGKTIIREYSPAELQAFESSPEALPLLGERTVDVYLNNVAYWRNIPECVWDYTIGGYQVLKKWLSYREDDVLQRPLRVDEARLFTEIARRIAALLLLSPALNANYEAICASTAQL